MIVVRLETKKGRVGPYQSERFIDDGYSAHNRPCRYDREECDTPLGKVEDIRHYVFGFKDWQQLVEWFPLPTRQELAAEEWDEPLVIAWYEVDPSDVVMGNLQLAFKQQHAKRIKVENVDVTQPDKRFDPWRVEAVDQYACAI